MIQEAIAVADRLGLQVAQPSHHHHPLPRTHAHTTHHTPTRTYGCALSLTYHTLHLVKGGRPSHLMKGKLRDEMNHPPACFAFPPSVLRTLPALARIIFPAVHCCQCARDQ